jgi:hypothetical protein
MTGFPGAAIGRFYGHFIKLLRGFNSRNREAGNNRFWIRSTKV